MLKNSETAITQEERDTFERQGYLIIENALTKEALAHFENSYNDFSSQLEKLAKTFKDPQTIYTQPQKLRKFLVALDGDRKYISDFLSERFIEAALTLSGSSVAEAIARAQRELLKLAVHETVFPKVWGILGWHIALLQVQFTSLLSTDSGAQTSFGWHQDGGFINRGWAGVEYMDSEPYPMPRLSMKAGYYLSDATQLNCGNMWVIPGSHLRNLRQAQYNRTLCQHPEAIPLRIPAGAAVLHDRRVWHAFSPNESQQTRKVIYFNYGYQWIERIDSFQVSHLLDQCDPIIQQLLRVPRHFNRYKPPLSQCPLARRLLSELSEEEFRKICPRTPSAIGTPDQAGSRPSVSGAIPKLGD